MQDACAEVFIKYGAGHENLVTSSRHLIGRTSNVNLSRHCNVHSLKLNTDYGYTGKQKRDNVVAKEKKKKIDILK